MKKILSFVMIGLLCFSMFAIFTQPVFATTSFVNVAESAGVDYSGRAHGVAFADYDNDGDMDLYVQYSAFAPTALFRNNGDGTFTDVASAAGVLHEWDARGISFADYDNDGDLDLFKAHTQGEAGVIFFRNNGDGTFSDVTSASGFVGEAGGPDVASGDYDNDGDLDIYVIRWGGSNVLYQNNGDGTFSDVTASAGVDDTGSAVGVAFADYDNDGDLDILINKSNREADVLYRNNGDGTFTNVADEAGIISPGYGSGVAFGDYDNDGDLDVYLGEGGANPGDFSHLFRNNGDGTFADVTYISGMGDHRSTHAVFLDYDNDGDLDIVASQWSVGNYLWSNNGDGTFSNVAELVGIQPTSYDPKLAIGDFDNDGDLDIFGAAYNDPNVLYRNDGGANNWLEVVLVGGISNLDGIGAKVKVIVGSLTQTREVAMDIGGESQQSLRAHFGLGTAEAIDRIEVMWPSGIVQVLYNIEANQIVSISETARALTVELAGEFDYMPRERVKIRISALVKDATTTEPVSDADVTLNIYDPEGEVVISGVMTEHIPESGVYEWQSDERITSLGLEKGVYLVHVKASYRRGTASGILEFHIDPPEELVDLHLILSFVLATALAISISVWYLDHRRLARKIRKLQRNLY